MKTVATIEARMTSTRLPGKPMLMVNGATMLATLVKRLKSVDSIDQIVLATTTNHTDDILVSEAEALSISVYRGSEDNVLDRVLKAADSVNGKIIVEITGDCPLIDPNIIEQCIKIYECHNVDYVSNVIERSYPDGMDVQVFDVEVLRKSSTMTTDPLDLEHVSLHIRNNPEIFSRIHLIAPPNQYWPNLGVTLDERDDFKLISQLISALGKKTEMFTCLDIIEHLKSNPSLVSVNSSVVRKGNK